ncbi:MAG: hypothetical protein Greene041619_1115 [Candidatus Peregrinibacteria bacterium Greene0416_19]|nr:MAG: hypothetical protein Greene041619_1115 [Candidatus Peregrinibacteria bacterium Greene0416_19]
MNAPHPALEQFVSAGISPVVQVADRRTQVADISRRTAALWEQYPTPDAKLGGARAQFFSVLDGLYRSNDQEEIDRHDRTLRGLLYETIVLDDSLPVQERLAHLSIVCSMPGMEGLADIFERIASERADLRGAAISTLSGIDGQVALALERKYQQKDPEPKAFIEFDKPYRTFSNGGDRTFGVGP